MHQGFSLLNPPGFLSFATADCTSAATNHTLPNFSQTPPLCLSTKLYAASGTNLPNGLKLLQHLPCINSFSSCVPVHTPPSWCWQLLSSSCCILLSHPCSSCKVTERSCSATFLCGFALLSLPACCHCSLLQEGKLHPLTDMGREIKMHPQSAPRFFVVFWGCFFFWGSGC